jgi:hypothetical protein
MNAALSCLALVALAAQDEDPGWLVVRGDAQEIGTLTFEQVAEIYLPGERWRVVHESRADADAPTSRLVVGSPAHNPLARRLGSELGVEWTERAFRFRGQDHDAGVGLVAVAPDPDGAGLVALLTGADQAGAWECFKTNVDVHWPGYLVTRGRQTLASGPMVEMDTARPVVVRLDQAWDREWAATEGWPAGERALRLGRMLVGDATVVQRAGFRGSDMLVFAAGLDARLVARTRARFAEHDLAREILSAWELCTGALGAPAGPAPMDYVCTDPSTARTRATSSPTPITAGRACSSTCAR